MSAEGSLAPVAVGQVRRPRNLHLTAAGSIHDDNTAQKLGFRGGTIAGSYHMEQAVPVALELFGPTWFETGTMSAYFRRATVDGEPVQVFGGDVVPYETGQRATLQMSTPEGERVWDGSATVGCPTGASQLADRIVGRDADQVRILAAIEPGEKLDLGDLILDGTRQRGRLHDGLMTEPLEWYDNSSPWGPGVASPPTAVSFTFETVKHALAERRGAGVGLYGAIELRHLAGPLLLDQTYRVTSTVLAVGCTPKTEYVWTDTVASRDGVPIAAVLMMSRVMKASSELYS